MDKTIYSGADATIENLEICFNYAKDIKAKFVAVVIEMGYEYDEVIINPIGNADKKLEYYKNAYNSDLIHKSANGIKIVAFTFGNNFSDIEADIYL
jgi:hypothetical protein